MNIIKFKDGIYDTEIDEFFPAEKVESELDIAKKFLTFISHKRLQNKNECLNVGSILYNIGKGSYQALGIWIELVTSFNHKIFSELICIKWWSTFTIKEDHNWLQILHDLVESDTKNLNYDDFLVESEYEESDDEEISNNEKEILETKEEIKKELEETKEEVKLTFNEIFNLFVDECLIKNNKGNLTFTDFSDVFVPWVEENFPEEEIPAIKCILSLYYSNKRCVNMVWKDYAIKNEYERHQARQIRISKQ